MERYRVNLKNHFIAFYSIFIVATIMLAILAYYKFDESAIVIFGIFFLIDLIPVLYLHIEYWMLNGGEEYEIHFDEIIRFKNGNREVYKSSDIDKVRFCMSPAVFKKSNFHLLGMEAYHYARIYLKSGEELIITCLLAPKVEKALSTLKGVKVERKKRLPATVFWK